MTVERLLKAGLVTIFLGFVSAIYTSSGETVIGVSDSAPDFLITADGGRPISPSDFGGKALLLNFWATWCEPCQVEIPSLEALARTLGPKGLVVLAVSQDQDASVYSAFIRPFSRSILTFRQPDKTIQLSYGTTHIPESYLIDRRGRVRARFISNQDWISPAILEQVKSLL